MRRDEGDKERLKALLVEGRDWAPLGTSSPETTPTTASSNGPEDDEPTMGAAGFEPPTSRV